MFYVPCAKTQCFSIHHCFCMLLHFSAKNKRKLHNNFCAIGRANKTPFYFRLSFQISVRKTSPIRTNNVYKRCNCIVLSYFWFGIRVTIKNQMQHQSGPGFRYRILYGSSDIVSYRDARTHLKNGLSSTLKLFSREFAKYGIAFAKKLFNKLRWPRISKNETKLITGHNSGPVCKILASCHWSCMKT